MSRLYSMFVRLSVPTTAPEPAMLIERAIDACDNIWELDIWNTSGDTRFIKAEATGEAHLCGGEQEDEFVDRLSRAVWAECEQYVQVEIQATCLENLPYEYHTRTKEEYDTWRAKPVTEVLDG